MTIITPTIRVGKDAYDSRWLVIVVTNNTPILRNNFEGANIISTQSILNKEKLAATYNPSFGAFAAWW
jgi:hypothetical protein